MSQENVEAFTRGYEAITRGDVEALLEELDADVEWHSAVLALVGGEATVYRGHEGVREMLRDLWGAFAVLHAEYPETRDLGDCILAIGRIRARGRASGAEIESPLGYVTDFTGGKATQVRGYLDHGEALEAAGLSE
jgi:ketosteroid isomerase-like protein